MQHLQTIHNTHSTMTNLMELRHHTTQHRGDDPVREDVFCFVLLCSNKAIQAHAKVTAKWTYLCHLELSTCLSSGSKAFETANWLMASVPGDGKQCLSGNFDSAGLL